MLHYRILTLPHLARYLINLSPLHIIVCFAGMSDTEQELACLHADVISVLVFVAHTPPLCTLQGKCSVVYTATDSQSGQPVAVKLYRKKLLSPLNQ